MVELYQPHPAAPLWDDIRAAQELVSAEGDPLCKSIPLSTS